MKPRQSMLRVGLVISLGLLGFAWGCGGANRDRGQNDGAVKPFILGGSWFVQVKPSAEVMTDGATDAKKPDPEFEVTLDLQKSGVAVLGMRMTQHVGKACATASLIVQGTWTDQYRMTLDEAGPKPEQVAGCITPPADLDAPAILELWTWKWSDLADLGGEYSLRAVNEQLLLVGFWERIPLSPAKMQEWTGSTRPLFTKESS